MAKDCSRKTGDDSTAQLDRELRCSRQVPPCLLRHGAECGLVAKFIYGKLSDSIGNLPVKGEYEVRLS